MYLHWSQSRIGNLDKGSVSKNPNKQRVKIDAK